jgi:hypothetical protein
LHGEYATPKSIKNAPTWSIDSGTCMAGHTFSILTFPAAFLNVLLNSALVSGISKGDRRMDCRRYEELAKTKHHAKT